jgi:hypothetical protein
MSHHSDGNGGYRAREMLGKLLQQEVAKTFGEFPNGRLNADDQGALPMMVGTEGETVRVTFPKPVAWIAFTPEEAVGLANLLLRHARSISKVPLTIEIPNR